MKFHQWRNGAIAYCDHIPEGDLDGLAYARHHGLATRLLDWTTNPLIGLFFAVNIEPDNDGAVLINNQMASTGVILGETRGNNIFHIKTGTRYFPKLFNKRIVSQNGKFTVQQFKSDVLSDFINIVKVIIPKGIKKECMIKLDNYGINYASIFPDIDGYSSYMNWRNKHCTFLDLTRDKDNPKKVFGTTPLTYDDQPPPSQPASSAVDHEQNPSQTNTMDVAFTEFLEGKR